MTEPIFRGAWDPIKSRWNTRSRSSNASDFVKDLLTNGWTDQGRTASALVRFDPGVATPTTLTTGRDRQRLPYGPHHEPRRTRREHPDSWSLVAQIPGVHETAGHLNPVLIQTLATSMSPYLSDLSGGAQHPGFDSRGI